ncbi:hypothetical protein [Flavobacterium soyae]
MLVLQLQFFLLKSKLKSNRYKLVLAAKHYIIHQKNWRFGPNVRHIG